MSEAQAPMGNTGDIINWPMLKIHYRTDPDAIAALLPPGFTVGKEPNVNLTVYNFPVPDVPEYGVVTTVNADFDGVEGEYTLGYGIDQESAIFISQETNGQPKYPCVIDYHRLGPMVHAKCTHQGYTFLEFDGMSEGEIKDIILVEVKTNKGSLNTRERQLRDAVNEGRVKWQEVRRNVELDAKT